MIGDRQRRRLDLGGVARIDDGQPGDHPHQRQILDRLMRAAIAGRQARQAGDDLHVEVGMGAGDGHEIDRRGAWRRRHRSWRRARSPVRARPAATATRFCSAMPTLKKRSGKGVAERQDVGVLAEIGGQPDDLGPRLAELRQRAAERRLDARPAAADRLVLAHGQRSAGLQLIAAAPALCSRTRR